MFAAIPLELPAAGLVAEATEDGTGIRQAHADVMDWLWRWYNSGKVNVKWWGLSATYSCYLRMNPTVTVVQKRAQGSDDIKSAWCQACMGWATQLLVRTQQDIPEEWGGPLTPEELLKPWFQVANLTPFSPHQVVDWDETHQDLVMPGGSGRSARGTEYQVRFHMMPDGSIDTTGGKQEGSTLAERKYRLSVKYEKHVRFLLGTASVLLLDGTLEGCRAKAQEYTDAWVSMDHHFMVHRQTEITRVIKLPGDGLPWVAGHRPKDGPIFEEDDVCMLDGIGDVTAKKLKYYGSVTTVGHVAYFLDEDIETLSEVNGLSVGILQTARLQARTAVAGKYRGSVIDHKKSKNPYKSLYGDRWMEEIDKSTYMRKYINIRTLVMHMALETDEVMKGTQFEGKGMFKHDALSLMTAIETRNWMKVTFVNGRSLYSRWLLPEAGLNNVLEVEGSKPTARFANRPPGNVPRLMSLDECANKNLMDCVNRHISATKRMDRGPDVATDPKYEFCDIKRASRALLRCWDPAHGPNRGAPLSDTLIACHKRVWGKHLGEIRANKGAMVGARSGHRRAEKPMQRGGMKVKGPAPWVGEGEWLNADARVAQELKFERCEANVAATS